MIMIYATWKDQKLNHFDDSLQLPTKHCGHMITGAIFSSQSDWSSPPLPVCSMTFHNKMYWFAALFLMKYNVHVAEENFLVAVGQYANVWFVVIWLGINRADDFHVSFSIF